jgi:methionyl aminopeptidase
MSILLKTPQQIELMRRTGQVAALMLSKMRRAAVPGVTTLELDRIAAAELQRTGAISMSKGFPTYQRGEGFPGYTCISVNDEVVHGVPGARVLRSGDIVALDVDPQLNGWCATAATTVPVGSIAPQVQRFLEAGIAALRLALESIRPGIRWAQIAERIQNQVESQGHGIVREFVGHGIGRRFVEPPSLLNYARPRTPQADFVLRTGMTLSVEPIITMGRRDVVLREDGMTVVTEDGLPAAHFRHTIAVTEAGADILTLLA